MSSAKGGGLVPTEDAVQALLDYLVEPILPRKSSENNPSNGSLQQSLATQLHAVVLLYNYYHRKQFPQLEFLDYESFCKVASNAKRSLLVHFNHVQKCKGQTQNFWVAEEAVFEACNISIGLDAMKDAPSMEGWPISKVAVFLVDSKKQNCSLHFSERTEGVWSLIEKDNGECNDMQKGVLKEKNNGTRLQQMAITAVKEKTGIDRTELTVLESHIAYSLTEEKSTACFFIMKSTSVNKDVFQVSIGDAIDSLQGPLVKKSCNSYVAADIVEYFHLLPYASMITSWFSRELLANGSVPLKEVNEPVTVPSTLISETTDFPVVEKKNLKSMDHKEKSEDQVKVLKNKDDDKSPAISHPSKKRKTISPVLVDNTVNKSSIEGDLPSTKIGSTVEDGIGDAMKDAFSDDLNVEDAQTSMHVDSSVDVPIPVELPNEQALVLSDTDYLDCMIPCSPGDIEYLDFVGLCSPGGAGKVQGSDVDILKPIASIYHEGDGSSEMMLKDVANINIPTDFNPDKPLNSSDKILLTEAVLKVLNSAPDQTSNLIRELHSCKNWGETKAIRDEILKQKNELLGLSQKPQLECFQDDTPETDAEVSNGEDDTDDAKMDDSIERLGQISTSVWFTEQYKESYKRIVSKYGNIIIPESKEATLFTDMVSTALKGLLEVVESMLQASPRSIDVKMLECWEMKIRFCEFAGLKVGWLRDHLERIKVATVSSDYSVVQEMEERVSSLAERLKAVSKRGLDLEKELEMLRSKEKGLWEQKVAVEADLQAAKLRQESFSFSLF